MRVHCSLFSASRRTGSLRPNPDFAPGHPFRVRVGMHAGPFLWFTLTFINFLLLIETYFLHENGRCGVRVGLGLGLSFPAPGCICVCAGSTRRCLRGPLFVSAFSKLGKNMHTLTQVYSKTGTRESLRISESINALCDSRNQVFAIEYDK